MNFADRLVAAIQEKQTPLIVGLDPRVENLPVNFGVGDRSTTKEIVDAFESFCNEIIDTVAPLVPAVKPQAAFFERFGPMGMLALWNVVRYAQSKNLLVIMDAKRGDIGSTAQAYADAFLGGADNSAWGCDALTVNPYLGDDSVWPFVERCKRVGAGIFVLVRTSNAGGQMLQELSTGEKTIYAVVGDFVQGLAVETTGECGFGSVGAVVGATHPEQLATLRQQMPNTIFLVPGLGAQGGTAADVASAFDEAGLGAVVNSSRAIIFAHQRDEYSACKDWQSAVESATRDTIGSLASYTTAGRLRS